MNTLTEDEVLVRFQKWADGEPSVRAAILTGSRVNPDANVVDAFSDFDIEVYVDNLESYRHNDDWMKAFGPILVRCPWKPESLEEGWLTRMAVFKNGFRIDFQLTDKELVKERYVDGYRVLLDKDHISEALETPTYEGYQIIKPSAEEWEKFVNEFWWDAIYTAKSLARDELFYAKFTFDSVMRFNYFQRLIEWVICIEHGWNTQPNKFGRFFKRYVSPDRWKKIQSTFAGADIQDNWLAFYNSLDLFRELANEVAAYFGYPYPHALDKEVAEYIDEIREVEL